MGDATPDNLHEITDRSSHDAVMAKALGDPPNYTNGVPTLLYVSSSVPACRTTTPKVVELAAANPHVQVYIMELTAETAPMIKYGPQNCPLFIMVRGRWAETVYGRDWNRVLEVVDGKFKESGT